MSLLRTKAEGVMAEKKSPATRLNRKETTVRQIKDHSRNTGRLTNTSTKRTQKGALTWFHA